MATHDFTRETGSGGTHGPAGDGDVPLDPSDMARLMRTQADRTRRPDIRVLRWLFVLTGVGWFVGFGLLWSSERGGNPLFRLPSDAADIAYAVVVALSSLAACLLGALVGRGMSGPRARTGAIYGFAWPIAMAGAVLFGIGLVRAGMPAPVAELYFPGACCLVAGVLSICGSAIWPSRERLALGGLLIATTIVATLLGTSHHALVYAVVAGGAFVVAGIRTGARAGGADDARSAPDPGAARG